MTKLVPLRSIEHGLRRALGILEDEGATKAIQDVLGVKRSASLLRKCADPDNDRHHLQFRYAVALDAACAKAGRLTPLLEVHQFLVERHARTSSAERVGGGAKLFHAVLALQAALGDVAQTVTEGLHAEGPGGTRLTNREKHAIYDALEAIDHESETIKRMIAH